MSLLYCISPIVQNYFLIYKCTKCYFLRVRADHGVENVDIARLMFSIKGTGRLYNCWEERAQSKVGFCHTSIISNLFFHNIIQYSFKK